VGSMIIKHRRQGQYAPPLHASVATAGLNRKK
jgi:hypothetical protein